MKFSSKIQKCSLSPMRKFHPYALAAKARGTKIYHLNIGQPDVETPPQFFETVRRFEQPVLAYAESPGVPVLIRAIRDYYARIGMNFEDSDVIVTTGGSEALSMILTCVLDDGDEVIIPEPFYPNYGTMVSITGGRICPVSTSPAEGYFYADRAKIEACINGNTRAILCTNPGNPTGTLLTREQMEMLADLAHEYGLFLIADEAYREFDYSGGPLQSFGVFAEKYPENIVIIDTVSKRFSACGARVGCLISRNRELMEHAMKLAQARLSVATLDQFASAEMYKVDAAYFASVRDEYKRRRDTVVEGLKKIPGVRFEIPGGAFYLMAALPVDDAEEFQRWLLEEFQDNGETVMFAPGGAMYATPGKGINEVRIAYVLKQEDLQRAIELLGLGIKAYNAARKSK